MSTLDLAIVGNGNFNALIDARGRVVWCCLPRFDSDPRFCALLNDAEDTDRGFYELQLFDFVESEQRYRDNSAIVETILRDRQGTAVQITDFAPRFKQFGRVFRPGMLVRQIEPVKGAPRVRVRLRPAHHYGRSSPKVTYGSNHIRFLMPDLTLRLTTDASPTYILEETPFLLEQPITLLLGPDESLSEPVRETAREFFERTDDYWREWCRYLSLPFEWQDAVIRAAITLKLSNFEETGAVIAAPTTSIPEAPGGGRNWDYRYCWLRDSYFVVHALNALGVTKTMEGYLNFIMNIVADSKDGYLQPVFDLAQRSDLDERSVDCLAGFRGMGPVRVGNDAYKQVQNDGYGSVVLACSQMFFDQRLSRKGDVALFRRLEKLGEQAATRWDGPDAGIWERRDQNKTHTYSSVMCWAACDRLAKIARKLGLDAETTRWAAQADLIRAEVLQRAWNAKLNSFTSVFGDEEVDAALLLLPQLGLINANDGRFVATVDRIGKVLRRGPYLLRYAADNFGEPRTAFNACTFWYIDALAALGRCDEARELFENMLDVRSSLGLLSEDIDPQTNELWGNFPQTYSMVGLIHSAMRLTKPWEEAF